MDRELARLRLAQCEETRGRVLRGDGVIGILPVDEIEQMVANYRALGDAGMADAWLGLARYHLDDNGLHTSLADAADCACRALALGADDARALLTRLLPALRSAEVDDPPHAPDANSAVEAALARDDDGSAHYLAGLLAFHGFGRTKDLAACARLHEAAAKRGNADAMFELYVLLSTGTGVAKDEAAALSWCRAAGERDHARACYNLGAFYATGRGVAQDDAAALRWYERASNAGHGRATATLAYLVHSGTGCAADPDRAETLFELAAEQGFDVESFREQLGI